jgi:N-acetylglucosamine kinase-like BadF-type ATPase
VDGEHRVHLEQSWGVPLARGQIDGNELARRLEPMLMELLDDRITSVEPHLAAGLGIGLSLAGIKGRQPDLGALHGLLRTVGPVHTSVVASDLVAALVGGLGGLVPGAVIVAGTGQGALSLDSHGRWRMAGGWGPLLDDEGSGCWIGGEGLQAALRAHDRRQQGSSLLLERAVAAFGDPSTWPIQFELRTESLRSMAAFAPEVTALAGIDPMAARICDRAVLALADTVCAVLDGGTATYAGGVFDAVEAITEPLRCLLASRGIELIDPRGGPLEGVLRLLDLDDGLGCPLVSRQTLPPDRDSRGAADRA